MKNRYFHLPKRQVIGFLLLTADNQRKERRRAMERKAYPESMGVRAARHTLSFPLPG